MSQIMKPTPEILKLAKFKAAKLGINTMQRICGSFYEKSYYVFNVGGKCYIGWLCNEELGKFFKNVEVVEYKEEGNEVAVAYMQRLKVR